MAVTDNNNDNNNDNDNGDDNKYVGPSGKGIRRYF